MSYNSFADIANNKKVGNVMNKNLKRTLLAVMVSSMLAASISAIPVAANGDGTVTPPPRGVSAN